MSEAGPISTITIAVSSFIGVIVGGILSDRWVQKNIRGRVYTGAIGLGMTIPALMLLGFGESFMAVVGAGLLFGIGFCQCVQSFIQFRKPLGILQLFFQPAPDHL